MKVLIALFLIGTIFSASVEDSQVAAIFEKLRTSKLGTNVYTTIMLELQTSSSEHVVDKILQLLYSLRDDSQATISDAEEDLEKHKTVCQSKPDEIKQSIADLQTRISVAESVIPGKNAELYSKKSNRADEIEIQTQAQNEYNDLLEANSNSVSEFNSKQEQHSKMIEALKQAKVLIQKLEGKTTGFLQIQNSDLVALQQHAQVAEELQLRHHRAVFKYLMQLCTESSMRADQDKVKKVLAIIDDLIAHEQDFTRVEKEVESQRLLMFEYQKKSAERNLNQILAMVQQLDSDVKILEVQLNELKTDIKNWKQEIINKNQQLADMANMCQDSLSEIEDFICAQNEELDVIKQVILIFESKSIQDIKKEINLQA